MARSVIRMFAHGKVAGFRAPGLGQTLLYSPSPVLAAASPKCCVLHGQALITALRLLISLIVIKVSGFLPASSPTFPQELRARQLLEWTGRHVWPGALPLLSIISAESRRACQLVSALSRSLGMRF